MSNEKPSRPDDSERVNQFNQLYILLQPTRQKIIRTLKGASAPMYIKEIADAIGESHRDTSFHLATLAANGFVEGKFREIEPPTHHSAITGRAAKFYRLTSKVDEVAKLLAKSL
ncbi:MAG: helix-turn-helix domain-containing protein [Thermoplasmata archaeon]|nr:helix-turn-helix domain-containing protein [Thermoplasmata archaeon]